MKTPEMSTCMTIGYFKIKTKYKSYLTYHFVNHLLEFLFSGGDTFRAPFNADDITILVVRGNANRYSSFILDAPNIGTRFANDVLVVLLVYLYFGKIHSAFQVVSDFLKGLGGSFNVLRGSFQFNLVLSIAELNMNLL